MSVIPLLRILSISMIVPLLRVFKYFYVPPPHTPLYILIKRPHICAFSMFVMFSVCTHFQQPERRIPRDELPKDDLPIDDLLKDELPILDEITLKTEIRNVAICARDEHFGEVVENITGRKVTSGTFTIIRKVL